MEITILETGKPPRPLDASWPSYPDMFSAAMAAIDPSLTFNTVDVIGGQNLPDPETLEAVLITGSPASVYDDAPWIRTLLNYIGWLAEANTPTIGICFGHQAIAKALGGIVEKSDKGWGIGRHTYDITARQPWWAEQRAQFSLAVSHQDQVLEPPLGARTLAQSDFTPFAALQYAQGPMISFQGHPEFSAEYAQALYRLREGQKLTQTEVKSAGLTLNAPLDNGFILDSAIRFIKTSRAL